VGTSTAAPGEAVTVPDKYVPHFKPGKQLRERVDRGKDRPIRNK
jgi:integration host factor subunit beta